MKEYKCNFYEIDFYDSFLEQPTINGNSMTIRARDVILLTGLLTKPKVTVTPIDECILYFEGVRRSEKKMYEYIGDPAEGNFADPYVIFDGPFEQFTEEPEHFEMEGVIEKPPAWVAWDIEALVFRLEIPDDVVIPE